MDSSEEVRPCIRIGLEPDTIPQSFSTELELDATSESVNDNHIPKRTEEDRFQDDYHIPKRTEEERFQDLLRVSFEDNHTKNIHRRRSTLRNRRKSFARSIRSFPIGNAQIEDHFSIPKHSSTYSHHGKDTLIFPLSPQGALMLENDKLDVTQPLTVKYCNDATTGFYIIRAFHTLVALLVAVMVFLFSIQVILFL